MKVTKISILGPVARSLVSANRWLRGFFFFFFFFLTALLAFYSVTIVINEKLHVHNYEGKK